MNIMDYIQPLKNKQYPAFSVCSKMRLDLEVTVVNGVNHAAGRQTLQAPSYAWIIGITDWHGDSDFKNWNGVKVGSQRATKKI